MVWLAVAGGFVSESFLLWLAGAMASICETELWENAMESLLKTQNCVPDHRSRALLAKWNLLLCVGELTICNNQMDSSLDREINNVRLRANVPEHARDGLPILKVNARLHVAEMASAPEAIAS